MNYEEFKQQVVDQIKDHLPPELQDCNIGIQQIDKNNVTLDGLIIQDPASPITPTIYLNPLFEDHQNGRPLDSILDQIAEIRTGANLDLSKDFDYSMLTDYDQAKDHIVCHLVGSEHNQSLLADRPHTMVEDLAVTYHLELSSDENGSVSSPITNQQLAVWGVSLEELHETALSNTEALSPHQFSSMRDTMLEIMLPEMMSHYGISKEEAMEMAETMMPPDDGKMFVLTNNTKVNGAAALLNDQALQDISEQLGENFFVLPSSIHEVLIIPKSAGMDYRELESMVQEINAAEVAPQDRLSDHVYEYDAQDHELFRSDRAEARQAEKEATRCDEKNEPSRDSSTRARRKDAPKKESVLGKLNAAKDQADRTPHKASPTRNQSVAL